MYHNEIDLRNISVYPNTKFYSYLISNLGNDTERVTVTDITSHYIFILCASCKKYTNKWDSSEWCLPAARASLQASYISSLISRLSSAIVSPTVTNLSTARFTACPTRATALRLRSEHNGLSRWVTSVEICRRLVVCN